MLPLATSRGAATATSNWHALVIILIQFEVAVQHYNSARKRSPGQGRHAQYVYGGCRSAIAGMPLLAPVAVQTCTAGLALLCGASRLIV